MLLFLCDLSPPLLTWYIVLPSQTLKSGCPHLACINNNDDDDKSPPLLSKQALSGQDPTACFMMSALIPLLPYTVYLTAFRQNREEAARHAALYHMGVEHKSA